MTPLDQARADVDRHLKATYGILDVLQGSEAGYVHGAARSIRESVNLFRDRISYLEAEIAKLRAVAEAAKNGPCRHPSDGHRTCPLCIALTRLAEKDGGK